MGRAGGLFVVSAAAPAGRLVCPIFSKSSSVAPPRALARLKAVGIKRPIKGGEHSFDRRLGRHVTIPSLPEITDWRALGARQSLAPKLSLAARPASRRAMTS